mmetsp:Transcript_17577/g.27380  ORF Transcript_17577/g.27380 Transcript_17577/m.27380 type:complete len:267 (-) Transcript_17577:143-943(-)
MLQARSALRQQNQFTNNENSSVGLKSKKLGGARKSVAFSKSNSIENFSSKTPLKKIDSNIATPKSTGRRALGDISNKKGGRGISNGGSKKFGESKGKQTFSKPVVTFAKKELKALNSKGVKSIGTKKPTASCFEEDEVSDIELAFGRTYEPEKFLDDVSDCSADLKDTRETIRKFYQETGVFTDYEYERNEQELNKQVEELYRKDLEDIISYEYEEDLNDVDALLGDLDLMDDFDGEKPGERFFQEVLYSDDGIQSPSHSPLLPIP